MLFRSSVFSDTFTTEELALYYYVVTSYNEIVILDEATASVDTDNESYIQEAINELVKGKTSVSYTHLDVYKRQGLHHQERIA